MNIRILICGIVSGLASTVALSLPLLLNLPSHYSSDWRLRPFGDPVVLGIIGYTLAALVGIGTGYCAARWSWAASTTQRLKSGALAGLIGSVIMFPLIGAAAAGLAGTEPVYLNGARSAGSDAAATQIVAETVVRVGWYPYLTFWVMALSGAALGALGGWVSGYQRAGSWGTTPPLVAEEPVDASLAILVVTALILVTCVAAITAIAKNADASAQKYGFTLSLPARGVLDWPVGMCLLICTIATWFCGRWCASRRGHPIRGVRRTVFIATIFMIAVPVLALGLSFLHLQPSLIRDPIVVMGSLCWMGVAGFWVRRIRNGQTPSADIAPVLSFRDRLLINAGVLGAVLPALVMITGLSQAVSLAVGVVPFLTELFGRTEPGQVVPTVSGSMMDLYAIHFVYSFYVVAGWMTLALIHALAVLVWQAFRRGRAPVAVERK